MQTGPGFALTFLYYFAITVAIVTPLSTRLGGEVTVPGLINPLIGVVAGGLGAYFNRSQTITWPITSQKTFQRSLEESLTTLGYVQVDPAELNETLADWQVYRRSRFSQVFSGKIYVKIEPGVATIASRAVHIRQLQARLQASLGGS